jgi:hypothetical protein
MIEREKKRIKLNNKYQTKRDKAIPNNRRL